jgi:hypothetical protein
MLLATCDRVVGCELMKDLYRRTTRLVPFASLGAPLREALGARAVVAPETEVVRTVSTRAAKPGFFARLLGTGDPDAEHETVLLIVDGALLVAVHGVVRGTTSWRLPLGMLELGESLAARLPNLELPASVTLVSPLFGASEQTAGTYTVYFGPEAEGPAFVESLRAAIRG